MISEITGYHRYLESCLVHKNLATSVVRVSAYYYKELNLENRIKELQKQNIRVSSVINLSSLINTNDDIIIKDVLEKYQLENLKYPEQEKFNSIKLNGYKKDKSKYKEIDWVGYNWLVVLFENETKKYHLQIYKHLENLKYEY